MNQIKVAIITEAMFAPGGGDRYLLSLLKVYPYADVYTPVWNKYLYADRWQIPTNVTITTRFNIDFNTDFFTKKFRHSGGWLRKIGLSLYGILVPFFYESLDLSEYDLVISVSARFAHGVITNIQTKHVNIYLTPARYEWHNVQQIDKYSWKHGFVMSTLSTIRANWFRIWDWAAAKRADANISISHFVQKQIKKYYRCESDVIYPAIPDFWFEQSLITFEELKKSLQIESNVWYLHLLKLQRQSQQQLQLQPLEKVIEIIESGDFFLVVTRLYDYKRVDMAIKACQKTGQNLIIVGDGPETGNLKKLAKKGNVINDKRKIYFIGFLTDEEVKYLYSKAKAFLFCGIEDFGLVLVEAMAQGCPIIGPDRGGTVEIIQDGVSGYIYSNFDALTKIMSVFTHNKLQKKDIVKRARFFSQEKFEKNLKEKIQNTKN